MYCPDDCTLDTRIPPTSQESLCMLHTYINRIEIAKLSCTRNIQTYCNHKHLAHANIEHFDISMHLAHTNIERIEIAKPHCTRNTSNRLKPQCIVHTPLFNTVTTLMHAAHVSIGHGEIDIPPWCTREA